VVTSSNGRGLARHVDALNPLLGSMVLGHLAHEETMQRAPCFGTLHCYRRDQWHRTHLQPADAVDLHVPELVEDQFGEKARAFRMQHRGLAVEVVGALFAGGQGEATAPERALLDEIEEPLAKIKPAATLVHIIPEIDS